MRYPEGIEWNGKPTTFVIGIAGVGDEHLSLLQRIAHVFLDKSKVAALEAATTPEQVQAADRDIRPGEEGLLAQPAFAVEAGHPRRHAHGVGDRQRCHDPRLGGDDGEKEKS